MGITGTRRCRCLCHPVVPVTFPTPAEDGIAVSCIPLQRCWLQRRSCPRATLIVAAGLWASAVVMSDHVCTADMGEGGPDPHISVSCSEEAGRAGSAWRKRAGRLGSGRLGGIAGGFVGTEELRTQTPKGPVEVLSKPNVGCCFAAWKNWLCWRADGWNSWRFPSAC